MLSQNFTIRQLGKEDIQSLIALYKAVFPVYPFPIFDIAYIESTMKDSIQYLGVFEKGRLLANNTLIRDGIESMNVWYKA